MNDVATLRFMVVSIMVCHLLWIWHSIEEHNRLEQKIEALEIYGKAFDVIYGDKLKDQGKL